MRVTTGHSVELGGIRWPDPPIWDFRWVCWWSAGAGCVAAPVLSSLWTANRAALFYPALILCIVVGALLSPLSASFEGRRSSPALLVAMLYPLSCVVALIVESIQVEEGEGVGTFLVWGLVSVAIPPLLAFWPRWPGRALAWGGAAWATVALLTLPLYGLGVVFIPLAVSYALAAMNARRPSTDPS